MTDRDYMKLALEEAVKGEGYVSPNPMVGAVIVKDGRIIAKGYHHRYGDLHAERDALKNCTENPEGATMYVTLEPCCHQGKQPPCTQAVIESGIRRVVTGSGDPNPLVGGKGIAILKNSGIEVTENVLEEECLKLNEIFFHFIRTGQPFVTMKYAMTMDGKIAAYTGKSKWITGELSRENVQSTRHKYSGIMVGVGTVLADDPMLNCRMEGGKDPTRIICDTNLRTPLNAKIVQTAKEIPTILAVSCDDHEKIEQFENCGCRVLNLPKKNGHVDLQTLMKKLGEIKIDSILLEGGAELNWSALESKIVSKVQTYISPKLLGGSGKSPIGGMGAESPDSAFGLTEPEIYYFGEDIMIESRVRY